MKHFFIFSDAVDELVVERYLYSSWWLDNVVGSGSEFRSAVEFKVNEVLSLHAWKLDHDCSQLCRVIITTPDLS